MAVDHEHNLAENGTNQVADARSLLLMPIVDNHGELMGVLQVKQKLKC